MAYKSNRNRHGTKQETGPSTTQMLEAISYRQGVQERMLLRVIRLLRLQGSALIDLTEVESTQMFDINRLVAAAAAQTNATTAMKEAVDKMVADLREAQDDPEQLEAVLTAMEANTAVIAAAATANTPADTGEPVPPVVVTPGSQGGGTNET